jgi:glycosyltransferase involved in cell wall biosynthesis
VVIPWKASYLLPELNVEERSLRRLEGLARFSGNSTSAIVFDCIPITMSETTSVGIGARFASYLAVLQQFSVLSPISESAALEYEGWRRMVRATGADGPRIVPVVLPIARPEQSIIDLTGAREHFTEVGIPLFLCVGSNEPRKNHLALLAACEILWKRGGRFSVAFIGGNAWKSDAFVEEIERLRSIGWPVSRFSGMSDPLLWGAYVMASGVLFPSLGEGFGLPAAEALAMGVPILTSNFGSMQELAAHGGAVLVDPRDIESIARGLDRLIADESGSRSLREAARGLTIGDWDEYSSAVWQSLTVL